MLLPSSALFGPSLVPVMRKVGVLLLLSPVV